MSKPDTISPEAEIELAARLRTDAARLPGCPSGLSAKVAEAVRNGNDPIAMVQPAASIRRIQRVLLPVATAAAAIFAIWFTSHFIQSTGAPATGSETASIPVITDPVKVVQMVAPLQAAVDQPYEQELLKLEQDVGSATRFLMKRFGSTLPSLGEKASTATPRG